MPAGDRWSVADIAWGRFLALSRVPDAGYRWVDELDGLPGPWLVPIDAAGTVNRQPTLLPDLHRQFARLHDKESIRRFAGKYGRLRCEPEIDHGDFMYQPSGERLVTWLGEARRMALLVALGDLLQAERTKELREYVRWSTQPETVTVDVIYNPTSHRLVVPGSRPPRASDLRITRPLVTEGGGVPDARRGRWHRPDVLGPTRYFITQEINERLAGHVNPVLHADDVRMTFQPDTLLAALYLVFALDLAQEPKLLSRCLRCGEPFRGHGNRRYCSDRCHDRAAYYRRKEKRGARDAPR